MDILAIDPGNVTGIAWWSNDHLAAQEEIEGGLFGFVDWWHNVVQDGMCWHNYSAGHPNGAPPDLILVEDFIIDAQTHKKTREPAAYELVGWVKGKAHEEGIQLDVIGASGHTSFSGYKKKKTSKIVRLGWHIPSPDMHYDSATSLLLTGMVRHDKVTATKLLKEIATDA